MKILLFILLLLISIRVMAPGVTNFYIEKAKKIDPYERIMKAIGFIESTNNIYAYNPIECATGYFQITPIRLRDYLQRTGDTLTLNDMFDYDCAERVFKYYATHIGWQNSDEVILSWNCYSKEYLKKVKEHLK